MTSLIYTCRQFTVGRGPTARLHCLSDWQRAAVLHDAQPIFGLCAFPRPSSTELKTQYAGKHDGGWVGFGDLPTLFESFFRIRFLLPQTASKEVEAGSLCCPLVDVAFA